MRTGPPLRHGVAAYGDEIVSVLRIVQRTGTKGDNVLRRYAVLRNVSACALAKPDDSGTTNTAEPVGIGQDVRPEIRCAAIEIVQLFLDIASCRTYPRRCVWLGEGCCGDRKSTRLNSSH